MRKKKDPRLELIENIIRGPVTTGAGLVALLGSIYFATFTTQMDWIYEGIAGVVVGIILIFSPDSIKGLLETFVKNKTNNLQSPNDDQP